MNRILCKLKNCENAKPYTKEFFNNMADWSKSQSHSGTEAKYEYTLKSGQTIYCDSRPERNMAKYLDDRDLFISLGSQAFCIKYDTEYSKDKDYFPDFVILTKDYHIAIIEVKALSAMSYHLNLEKYKALEKYCKEHGFEYMMIDPDYDYKTIDELMRIRVNKRLENAFIKQGRKKPNEETLIDKELVSRWYEEYGKNVKNKTNFDLQVHSLLIQKKWYNTSQKNGIRAYRNPVFQSKKKESKAIITVEL